MNIRYPIYEGVYRILTAKQIPQPSAKDSRGIVLSCITIVNGLPKHYEENRLYFLYFPSFTASKNVFAGLNAGTE